MKSGSDGKINDPCPKSKNSSGTVSSRSSGRGLSVNENPAFTTNFATLAMSARRSERKLGANSCADTKPCQVRFLRFKLHGGPTVQINTAICMETAVQNQNEETKKMNDKRVANGALVPFLVEAFASFRVLREDLVGCEDKACLFG